MADLEQRVDRLEEKVSQLEIDINKSLSDIKSSLVEIKATLSDSKDSGDLKNEVIKKDIESNDKRITKLEDNQSKVVWAFASAFIGLLVEAVALYLRTK